MRQIMPPTEGLHPATVAFLNGGYMCATPKCGGVVPAASFYQSGGMRDPARAGGQRRCPACVALGWPWCMPATDLSPALATASGDDHGSSSSGNSATSTSGASG